MIRLRKQAALARQWAATCGLLLILGGCALGRDTVAVPVDPGPAPATGPAVTFVKVTDARTFEKAPRQASTPSLMNEDEINNPAITARAIARKRGGFGKALGDIVLPEGQTVAGLVEGALARGFQKAGWRVVPTDAADAETVPVEARIDRFWAWFSPGFASIAVECISSVRITAASTPFADGGTIDTRVTDTGMAATESMWIAIVQKALDDLSDKVYQRLAVVKQTS